MRELEKRNRRNESNNQNNLFLKGLKPEVTKEDLIEQFKKYGDLVSTAVKEFTY
jgi:RNA recognition motif-containing protein